MRETRSEKTGQQKAADAARAARLKAALKANIAKRKAQARARQGGQERPDNDKA
ncbi:hypothetical protein [Natronohydrobacter thiooxidans]|jgi:hypothetical protein|uniref:hypothetical protein n=1 Tax=Natronohydrobacter thiooxidans TaxID=87172 RepID=UPI000AE8E7AC|nr:hypothetical protein [Natronohydrobacter thiooxidans]